jgi:CIC family chloride channel protein
MVFELTGGFALAVALLTTVGIANGLAHAVHGRSYFHWQLEMRGMFLQEGPHRYLVRNVRVGQFMDPIAEGETATFDPAEGKPYLRVQDTLETALRTFDTSRDSRLPVVRSEDIRTVVGWASQVRALRYFNRELIQVSVEEHR